MRPENFLNLYLRHVGKSQVPLRFHLWSGLSLLAGCLQNRVWFEKWKGRKLLPNLYVILIAPSGVGKGEAIREAVKFVARVPRARLYQGEITGPALLKHISTSEAAINGSGVLPGVIHLSTPELSQQVGQGQVADSFIKTMTQLWDGGEIPFRKATITNWSGVVKDYCVNWLGGSEAGWLADALNAKAVRGGFFARTVTIRAPFDPTVRVREIEYPPDWEDLKEELAYRVKMLLHPGFTGTFRLGADASEIADKWFYQRPAPTEEELIPFFCREDDLVLKLSMLFAVSEGVDDWYIRRRHIEKAQTLVADVRRGTLDTMRTLVVSGDRNAIEHVFRGISDAKILTRPQSLQHAMRIGLTKWKHDQIIETLVQGRRIRIDVGERKGCVYSPTGDPRFHNGDNGNGKRHLTAVPARSGDRGRSPAS